MCSGRIKRQERVEKGEAVFKNSNASKDDVCSNSLDHFVGMPVVQYAIRTGNSLAKGNYSL